MSDQNIVNWAMNFTDIVSLFIIVYPLTRNDARLYKEGVSRPCPLLNGRTKRHRQIVRLIFNNGRHARCLLRLLLSRVPMF